jgi:hypothetical protein
MASKQVRAPVTQKASKLQWLPDQEAIDKLRANGQFIHVGGPKAKTSRLTGALHNKWEKKEPEAIFNTTYRISGPTPQAVYDALIAANYQDADARAIVADSVSYDNYQSNKKDEYDAEFAYRKTMPKVKKEPSDAGYNVENILWFADQLKVKGNVQVEQNVSVGKKAVSHPGRAHSGVSFAEKVANLKDGSVLDVSNMDLESEYGHGARTHGKLGPRTGKLGLPQFPGLVSNKIAQYRRAVQLAYGDQALVDHANDLAQLEGNLSGKVKPSAVAPPVAVVPGQTVAAPVNFQPLPVVSSGVVLPPRVKTPVVPTIGGGNVPKLPTIVRK